MSLFTVRGAMLVQLWRSQYMVSWPQSFGPGARPCVSVEACGAGSQLSSQQRTALGAVKQLLLSMQVWTPTPASAGHRDVESVGWYEQHSLLSLWLRMWRLTYRNNPQIHVFAVFISLVPLPPNSNTNP